MSFYADHIFPYLLDWATRPLAPQRKQTIAMARGKVLEIGVGTGANLPFYSNAVESVIGIEPDEAMLEKARGFLQKHPVGITVDLQIGDAHKLNFPNQHFDTVIMCLVLCTIPDAERALREAWRVLKPDGKLIFLEHVRAFTPGLARAQDIVTPMWKHLGCGCHLNRDTESAISKAGFRFEQIERYMHPKMPPLGGAIIEGVAVKL